MNTVILNSSNWVGPSRLEYRFPQPQKFSQDTDTIALQSISMYSSMFNVEASRGNNNVALSFPLGNGQRQLYNWTLPDGYYTVNTLNTWLQQQFLANGLYTTDTKGQTVFYLELLINSTIYGTQINSYPIDTVATMTSGGLTYPATHPWTAPSADASFNAVCPQITFNSKFGSLIGFTGGTYPATSTRTTQNVQSNTMPEIAPVYSVIMSCNLITSEYPNGDVGAFYSFPVNVPFGGLMTSSPNTIMHIPIRSGQYSSIIIDLYDPDFRPLTTHDHEIVLILVVNKKSPAK
jgi:hypothetical protein